MALSAHTLNCSCAEEGRNDEPFGIAFVVSLDSILDQYVMSSEMSLYLVISPES